MLSYTKKERELPEYNYRSLDFYMRLGVAVDNRGEREIPTLPRYLQHQEDVNISIEPIDTGHTLDHKIDVPRCLQLKKSGSL